ncbi:MAG: ribosomal RNA small subunit methyltransferase G [Candidatus Binatia bacterium]|nr:MAG: ribosomal RNA small subunit methyltransferase G [Candidatus Binatia bacterium]
MELPEAERAALQKELAHQARRARIELDPERLAKLSQFVDLLLFWRRRMALVGSRTWQDVVRKHCADSFHAAHLVDEARRVADLGTGAGFPGLVLAIVCPGSPFVLVESRAKPVSFLRYCIREIGIENVEVVRARAEDFAAAPEQRGRYDLVFSRGVWPLDEFLSVSESLLSEGGKAIAMKGPRVREEAVGLLRAPFDLVFEEYSLEAGERRVLVVATLRRSRGAVRCFT